MCIAKKYLGNKGNFNEIFRKWIPEEKPVVSGLQVNIDGEALRKTIRDSFYTLGKSLVKNYGPEIPKLGTRIKILDTKAGCKGAIGNIGVVTSAYAPNGLLDNKPGYNVALEGCGVWKIHPDSEIEILE